MRIVMADLNRLMDKCSSCGGYPGIQRKRDGGKIFLRGHCCDCRKAGPQWEDDYGIAVIEWNKQQRVGSGAWKPHRE